MSVNTIESELIVELSKQEQQLLSGGVKGVIEAKGTFLYKDKSYPVTLSGTVRNLP